MEGREGREGGRGGLEAEGNNKIINIHIADLDRPVAARLGWAGLGYVISPSRLPIQE